MHPKSNPIRLTSVAPMQVPGVWSMIKAGLEEALEESGGDFSTDTVFGLLTTGSIQLWLITIPSEDSPGKYGGFVTTETLTTDRGRWLNLPFAYSVPPKDRPEGTPVSLVPYALEVLESVASRAGYHGVKFVSSRPGYSRVARGAGYSPRLVEYVKEL